MMSAARLVRGSVSAILSLYVVVVLLIMIRAGSPDTIWWWAGAAAFLAWAAAPFAAAALLIRRQNGRRAAVLSTVLMALAAGYSLYVYERAMFGAGARSTSGLIFIFLPLYQWVLPLTVLIVGAIGAAGNAGRND